MTLQVSGKKNPVQSFIDWLSEDDPDLSPHLTNFTKNKFWEKIDIKYKTYEEFVFPQFDREISHSHHSILWCALSSYQVKQSYDYLTTKDFHSDNYSLQHLKNDNALYVKICEYFNYIPAENKIGIVRARVPTRHKGSSNTGSDNR